ncbi:hypothetical protein [Sulfurimonas sp.]|uniref:hypothetical protein n=1 Tax=Sulfurimonas sp. TaxID=2022749 RepID=UPI002AB11DAC|nr:hypothetical protein [Sulfurimonas sp.]
MEQRSVNGRLVPTTNWIKNNKEQEIEIAYLGHYLIVSYLQIFKTGKDTQSNIFGKDRIDIEKNGEFRFFLPKKEFIYDNNVTIEVFAPDGELLGKVQTSYYNLHDSKASPSQQDTTEKYSIEINPKIIKLQKPDKKTIFYKKISGKLIDSSAQHDLTGLQIIIMARRENNNEYEALLSAKLNNSGYFYSELEKHITYDDAYVFIAGLESEQIPISLEDGELPKNIILVADLSTLDEEEIKKSVASLPNSNDLVNSSAFSQDLGGGCVDFTVPNRSLEEHNFFHTVRTTEPEIRSYTIGKAESKYFKLELSSYTSDAFSMFKQLIDSWNSIGLYYYEKESTVSENNKVTLTPVTKKTPSLEKHTYTKELKYMSNTLEAISTPVYFEVDNSYVNNIIDSIATYSANKHKLEQLHNKVQQAYCSTSVAIDNMGYCETINLNALEDNTNYKALQVDIKNLQDNIHNNPYTPSLDNGAFNSKIEDFLERFLKIKKIDNSQRKSLNKRINAFISMLDTQMGMSEKYKSYKDEVNSYLINIKDNINYGIENDFCSENKKSVAGIICLMQDYEFLKDTLSNKSIFTLGEIMNIGAFYNEFELSINYFSSLLEDFHTFYRKCNLEMLFVQDDYFIKNYKHIKAELKQLKLSINLAKNKIEKIELDYIHNHPGRKSLSVDSSIDWDETPTIYENTTIAHGHILQFKQVWKADGYSLGDLLYSLPLAPCQEKQIAIVDWDRREQAGRTEEQAVSESLNANISRERDIDEIINSTFSENVNARSSNKTKSTSAGASGGLGFSYGGFVAGASGGVSHSGSSSISTASQASSRNIAGHTLNRLQDNVSQSASSVRSQRNTVIQTVGQNESVTVQTEVIKNNNHCHSMTVEYFEVLKHYAVEQELVDAQECLFVPLPMSDFNYKKVLRWKNTLQGSMYGKELLKGFDAIERIESKRDTGLPDGSYADDVIEELGGYFTISFDLVRPYISKVEKANKIVTESIELKSFFPWTTKNLIFTYRKKYPLSEKEKNEIFEKDYAPEIVKKFIEKIGIYAIDKEGNEINLNTDVTLMSPYIKGTALKVNVALTTNSKVTRREIKHLLFRAHTEVTQSSKIIIKSAYIHYKTEYMSEFLLRNKNINNDIISTKQLSGVSINHFHLVPSYDYVTDAALIYTPMSDKEKINPKDEDIQDAQRLLGFLNEHLEMAHKSIWSNMDSSRLFGLLDGYIAPNAKGRSVASVVENKIMGIVGNNLVLKVVPGERLDPMLRGADLLEHYKPDTKPDPFRISVPTKGVYAESVMGKCNSCEEVDESRHWRFEDAPCGVNPTAIDSVSTSSRREDVGNLQVKDLPTNIINMQTPQTAPDPSGLMAAYGLLGKSDAFKDMTGLAGTQANALTALQTTSKSVTDLASISKDFANLAVMASQKKDASRQISEIKKLKKDGILTAEEENEKVKTVLDTYPNAAKSLSQDNTKDIPTIDNAIAEGVKKGYINPGSNISIQDKDKSLTVDNNNNSIENISAVNEKAYMTGGLGDSTNYNVLKLPKNIDKEKPNALVLLTYEDDEIMKHDESFRDVSEIEKQYNTYVVAIKTVQEFTDTHKNVLDYFLTQTGKKISFFYIHAHGSSKSITLSKNNTLLATSLLKIDLSKYYEDSPKGVVNSCLTAINYHSYKYNKLTSFAQEMANSMKASIQAAVTETYGSLTSDLQLVQKGSYIKKGFTNNYGYFLTSEGYLFSVERFKTDDEVKVRRSKFSNAYKIIFGEVPLKKDSQYAYLLYRYLEVGNKYVNNITLNVEEFKANKVFDLISDNTRMISDKYFITLEPKT